jgi:DNA polymerase III delta prime subunit
MDMNIHKNIKDKLLYFIETNKIPHIIFYGPVGSGKRSILNFFINKIYNNNKQYIKSYVMYVNCAHIKGIKFIRNELKFFAKTNIQKNNSILFKSIILFNADKLTVDAQSALRRCIEQFSHNTRFFIIIENKEKLLNPILSRFCNIFIPLPIINNTPINLHKKNVNTNICSYNKKRLLKLKKIILKNENIDLFNILDLVDLLYNKGYSALDIIEYLNIYSENSVFKYKFLVYFDKIKKEFRNEKILMLNIFYYIFMRKNVNLENIL